MAEAKNEVRLRARSIRDAIPPDQARAAAATAAAHLLALDAARSAAIVALYAPLGSELDTRAAARLLTDQRIPLAYPRILGSGRRLGFHLVADPAELAPGRFGILEPHPSAPVVPVERIDLFVVPGLAFDPRGARLGWGKGFYDATLALCPDATRVGYTYQCQIVDEIPSSPADAPMHFLVTEVGARACGGGGTSAAE